MPDDHPVEPRLFSARKPSPTRSRARRVLVIDDNEAIHADFRRIFAPESAAATSLDALSKSLFGEPTEGTKDVVSFLVDCEGQGADGIARVERQLTAGDPYQVAFVDIRMPPGMHGVETTKRLWQVDPHLQVVLCTAYSDFRWDEVASYLGTTANLHLLRKPFSPSEVRRMADVLTTRAIRLRRE